MEDNTKEVGKAIAFLEIMLWAYELGFENGKKPELDKPDHEHFFKQVNEMYGDLDINKIIT